MHLSAVSKVATRDPADCPHTSEDLRNELPCPVAGGRFQTPTRTLAGGMGVIYQTLETATGRLLAVKRIRRHHCHEPEAVQRFENESRILRLLQHIPAIPAHRGFQTDEYGPWLAMDWIEAQSLDDLLDSRKQRLPTLLTIRIFYELCQTMAAVHQLRVLHCDLKPENLLLDSRLRPSIIDFGSAIQILSDAPQPPMMDARQVGGTEPWMPPERSLATPTVGICSDVCSLGLTLQFALTGLKPHQQHNTRIPWCLRRVLQRATAGAPAERFQNMAEFAASLKRAGYWHRTVNLLLGTAALLTTILCCLVAVYAAQQHVLLPSLQPNFAAATKQPAEHPVKTPQPQTGKQPQPPDPHTQNMQKIQQTEAQRLEVPVTFTNSQHQHFQLVPAQISHGTPRNLRRTADETVQQRQQVLETVYLQMHEVSRGQFAAFVASTGYQTEAEINQRGGWGFNRSTGQLEFAPHFNWRNPGFPQTDEHPVVLISELDIQAYIQWLNQLEDRKYRLPTENEWFHARRAGTNTRFWTGDDRDLLATAENVADSTAKQQFPDWPATAASDGWVFTAPVGSLRPNPFGLHDMVGNVSEYCCDHSTLQIAENSPEDRRARTAARMAARVNGEAFCGTAPPGLRQKNNQKDPQTHCAAGFRLLCEIPTPETADR